MNTEFFHTHQKKILAGLGIVLITIIVMLISFSVRPSNNNVRNTQPTLRQSNSVEPRPTVIVRKPPQVKFSQWKNNAPAPSTKSTVNTHIFKTDFPDEYVTQLASTLQITGSTQKKENLTLISNSTNALIFNQQTGSFTYYSKEGVPLPNPTSPQEPIYSFLQQLGIYDPSMKITATYQKHNQEGMTYFEIHRDWNTLTLPLLNKFGLVSMPENERLSTLSFLPKQGLNEPNSKIFGTSDNADGLSRNDDFNTITVVLHNDRIVSVVSNMRPFNSNTLSQVSVKPYETALQELQQGQIDSIITAPSGQGFTNWDRVYPNNIAEAQEAVVTDSILTFLEEPLSKSQNGLQPFYVFKGYAMTETGFRINFIASVNAVTRNTVWNSLWQKIVAPVFALDEYQIGSQHQGTFELTVSPVLPSPTIGPSSVFPSPTPSSPQACEPSQSDLSSIQDWEGMRVGWYNGRYRQRPDDIPAGYYLADANFTVEHQLQDWLNRALERHEDGNFTDDDEGGIRQLVDIMREIFTSPGCPVRLTGPSPSLFVYSDKEVTIHPQFELTYSYPPIKNNSFSTVYLLPPLNYFYYEYQPVYFERPNQGWYISKRNLPVFIVNISEKLKLNIKEQERLHHEIVNASKDVKGAKIFIGIIDEQLINELLPLHIEPELNSVRIHFYLSSQKPKVLSEPTLKPITRTKEMILELGAVVYP